MDWDKDLAVAAAAHLSRALLERVNELLALVSTFTVACWSLWNGTIVGAYISGAYALFAYLWCRLARQRGDANGRARSQRQVGDAAQRNDGVAGPAADES